MPSAWLLRAPGPLGHMVSAAASPLLQPLCPPGCSSLRPPSASCWREARLRVGEEVSEARGGGSRSPCALTPAHPRAPHPHARALGVRPSGGCLARGIQSGMPRWADRGTGTQRALPPTHLSTHHALKGPLFFTSCLCWGEGGGLPSWGPLQPGIPLIAFEVSCISSLYWCEMKAWLPQVVRGGGRRERRENAEGSTWGGDAVWNGFPGSLLALRYRGWIRPGTISCSLVWICGYLYIIRIILLLGPK